MFSQTVEYALRTMTQLAAAAPAACTTEQVALATRVPRAYLSKVVQGLCQAGLLKSQRGIGGGISLARVPSEITILEVVNAVEPIERIRTCPLNIENHGVHLCPLHRRMDNAMASVELAFRNSTLAEILAEPTTSRPLCELPCDPGSIIRPATETCSD